MILSIILCTYNRKKFLELCLNSIVKQTDTSKDERIEIVIIDNNSTDDTKTFIANYQSTTPIVYYLEEEQGVSHARNRGIAIAKGDYLAFVDDDATINKKWLNTLLKGIKEIKADVFGGSCFPNFEIPCPDWIDSNYFIRKFKKTDGYLAPKIAQGGFIGGNMCIHKSVFHKIGNFDVKLGMMGNELGLGEEPDFFYRLANTLKGNRLYNLADMSISHFEATYKIEKKYMRERIILYGKLTVKLFIEKNKVKGYIMSLLKIIKQSFDLLLNLLKGRKFHYLKPYWTIQGLISGLFKRQ